MPGIWERSLSGVAMALLRLRIEPRELCTEDGSLPLTEAIVGAVDVVAVEPLARHAATIVNAAGTAFEQFVIRNDNAAFTGGHELARLETERAGYPV